MPELRIRAEGLRFPEGPVALGDGSVLVCEIQRRTLSTVSPSGEVRVLARTGGGPNGAAFGSDDAIYVADNGGFEFSVVDGILSPGDQPADYTGGRIRRVTRDGRVTDLYTEVDGHPLRGPNDLVFDGHGGFYFTDYGKTRPREGDRGGLYYALQDGTLVAEIAYPLSQPNGVGLSPDGRRIYVAETMTGRLWFWDVLSPGVLASGADPVAPAGATLLYGFGGFRGMDSLAVDAEGNVNVATLLGEGAITTISPAGEVVRTVPVPVPDPYVSNIAFGGPDLTTAFVTSSGRGILYAAEWPVPGLPPAFSPR